MQDRLPLPLVLSLIWAAITVGAFVFVGLAF
jgi:hypothetical protein